MSDHPLMRGRDRFNSEEIQWIRDQLSEVRLADRADQKRIRAALRHQGFRISDWRCDGAPFTTADFDALLASGLIVCDDAVGLIPLGSRPIADVGVPASTPVARPDPPTGADDDDDIPGWV